MSIDKTYSYKNHSDLTKITIFLLYLLALTGVILIGSSLYEYGLILKIRHGAEISKDLAKNIDTRQLVLVVTFYLSFILAGIFYLMWLYRAVNNGLSFNPKNTKFTPGWSVIWYFIPVVSLWFPYRAMQELWKVSKNPQNWQSENSSSLVKWWWFVWIISNIIGIAASALKENNIDAITNALLIIGISLVGQVICALLLISIIKEIYKMQTNTKNTIPVSGNSPSTPLLKNDATF